VSALLAFEVPSVNEETNTFLVLGARNVAMILAWTTIARRAAARSDCWAVKARQIELEILHVPERFYPRNVAPEGGLLARIAPGAVLVGFAVLWVGLMVYVFWSPYLHG